MNERARTGDGLLPLPDAAALYAQAPCGLLLTQADGLIVQVNDTLCSWLGRERASVAGAKFQDLLTVGSRIFHLTHWAPLLQLQGSVAEVKLEMPGPGGEAIPVLVNAVRREQACGVQHEIAVFVARERHQYERELLAMRGHAQALLEAEQRTRQALAAAHAELEAQRAMAEDRALFAEQMMGIVSHDLRNPLSVIAMGVRLLGRSELTPNQLKTLHRLSNAHNFALRLIADLLDFTQARLGRGLSMAVKPLALHELVADCLADLRLAYPECRIEHRRHGSGACLASADRLVQAIGNLVSNAARHGRPDGVITVTSDSGPPRCRITVHNEGAPVPPELLPRLFEPMVRGADRHAVEGVGLGLFIVREIARAHGGRVDVASSAGAGTTFGFEFPAAAPA